MGLFLIFKDCSESRVEGLLCLHYTKYVYLSFVGAVAAFVTTPLDVAKTRIMLAKVYTHTHTHAAHHWQRLLNTAVR